MKNVYNKVKAVNVYEITHPYIKNNDFLNEVICALINIVNKQKFRYPINICDIGCGSGEIDINLFLNLKNKIRSFYCIDISEEMLIKFHNNLSIFQNENINNFQLIAYDLNKNFPGEIIDNTLSIILASVILHHLYNIDNLLHEVYNKLKFNGLFCIACLAGDYEIINANFKNRNKYLNEKKLLFLKFWEKYFKEKETYYKWMADYKATDYNLIFKKIEKSKKFMLIDKKVFSFSKEIYYEDFVGWISSGALTGLSIGINHIQRNNLLSSMKSWQLANNLINKKYNLDLFYKFYVYRKI